MKERDLTDIRGFEFYARFSIAPIVKLLYPPLYRGFIQFDLKTTFRMSQVNKTCETTHYIHKIPFVALFAPFVVNAIFPVQMLFLIILN